MLSIKDMIQETKLNVIVSQTTYTNMDTYIHEIEKIVEKIRTRTQYYKHGCITWNCYLDVLNTIYWIRQEFFTYYLTRPTMFSRFMLALCSMTEKYFFYQYQQTILSKEIYLELVNLFYIICFDYQDEFEQIDLEYKKHFNEFIQCISVFRTFYAIKTPFHLYIEFIHEYMSINIKRLNELHHTHIPPISFHKLFSSVENYYYNVLEFETQASPKSQECKIL